MTIVRSAGILLWRRRPEGVEVLLVHPGGPFHARKDEGAWSIPKGEIDDDEDPLDAARREFREETGFEPTRGDADCDGRFVRLAPVRQRSGKWVLAWAVEGDLDASRIVSNTFELEWPPRSGKVQTHPEVDRAQWFGIEEARRRILAGQRPLLEELRAAVG